MIIISGILSYSGISAKARAMGGKLLKKEQYEQLASCASVGEAVGYLRQFSEYEPLLRDFDEHDSHRGMIEATLMGSLYNDYNRLYSFARGEQRAFLDFYFLHYEAAYLKGCLRKVISGQSIQEDQAYRSAFFARHSHLDTDAIENSTTVDELIDALKNTPFYHPLDAIRHTEEPSLFDYEGSLGILVTFNYGSRLDGKHGAVGNIHPAFEQVCSFFKCLVAGEHEFLVTVTDFRSLLVFFTVREEDVVASPEAAVCAPVVISIIAAVVIIAATCHGE